MKVRVEKMRIKNLYSQFPVTSFFVFMSLMYFLLPGINKAFCVSLLIINLLTGATFEYDLSQTGPSDALVKSKGKLVIGLLIGDLVGLGLGFWLL